MVNFFRHKFNYWAVILFLCLLARPVFSVDEINTGNLLTNSTFDDGSLTGWTTNNTNQSHDGIGNECAGLAVDYDSSGCGISGTAALNGGGYIEQSVSLANDGGLTKSNINGGFKSTMSVDAWFWSGSDDQVIIRQTLVDDNGNVTTQTRIVTGTTDTVYTNGYDTYTDTIVVSENTQEDYTITARVGAVDGGGYNTGDSHNAPDIDNVTLDVTYYIPDILQTEQLEELEVETIEVISFEEYFAISEEETFVEEYEVVSTFEEMETSMLMAEEFSEPVTEEVTNDTYNDTGLEESTPIMEESPTNEESSPEVTENEEEPMEETTEEESEDNIIQDEENETPEETESDSEESEETDLQTEEEGEQETVQQSTIKQEGATANVGGVKLNLENVAKQLSKLDKFILEQPSLDTYSGAVFYTAKDIYQDSTLTAYLSIDLSSYSMDVYSNISLDTYVLEDPIEVQKKKLFSIRNLKRKLLMELEALKQ